MEYPRQDPWRIAPAGAGSTGAGRQAGRPGKARPQRMSAMNTRICFLLLALSIGAAAGAAETEARGRETRAWLDQQKSPTAQAPVRGLQGEAADRVYQRYLQSFTRPIPERFERDRTN